MEAGNEGPAVSLQLARVDRAPLFIRASEDEKSASFKQAAMVLASGLAPSHFKSPEAIIIAGRYGQMLGIDPFAALWSIYIVNGKPSISAATARALAEERGIEFEVIEYTHTAVTVTAQRQGVCHACGSVLGIAHWVDDKRRRFCDCGKESAAVAPVQVRWTMEDAKRARLDGKDIWKAYPRAMLRSRATLDAIRIIDPGLLSGVLTDEQEAGPAPVKVKAREVKPAKPEPPKTRAQEMLALVDTGVSGGGGAPEVSPAPVPKEAAKEPEPSAVPAIECPVCFEPIADEAVTTHENVLMCQRCAEERQEQDAAEKVAGSPPSEMCDHCGQYRAPEEFPDPYPAPCAHCKKAEAPEEEAPGRPSCDSCGSTEWDLHRRGRQMVCPKCAEGMQDIKPVNEADLPKEEAVESLFALIRRSGPQKGHSCAHQLGEGFRLAEIADAIGLVEVADGRWAIKGEEEAKPQNIDPFEKVSRWTAETLKEHGKVRMADLRDVYRVAQGRSKARVTQVTLDRLGLVKDKAGDLVAVTT